VLVVSDAWGLPTEVVENDGDSRDRGIEGWSDRGVEGSRDRGIGGADAPSRREGGVDGRNPVGGGAERGGDPVGGGREDGEAPVGVGGKRVEEVVETWIVQDEWWRAPIHRRYVEVVLEGGAHVVLFEDLTTGEWFLQKP